MNESASLRLQILSDGAARKALRPFFLQERSDSGRIAFLDSLKEVSQVNVFARYLLGREYSIKGDDSQVIRELQVLSPMDSPILEYLRNRRIARAMYNLGNFERAKLYSWRALNYAPNNGQLYQTEDFLLRCSWIQEHLQ
jgi:hypothetical protein